MSIENPTLAHFRHFSSLLTNLPSITLFLCAFCAFLWLKNPFNQRNQRLINDLRLFKSLYNCKETFTDVMSALQIRLFMQNKANFRKSQMNVNKVLTKDYDKKTLGQHGKTKPIKANQSQFKANSKPIKANKTPKQTRRRARGGPNKPNMPEFSPVGGKFNFHAQKIDGSVQISKIADNVGFAHKGLCFLGGIDHEDCLFECTFNSSFVCDWLL